MRIKVVATFAYLWRHEGNPDNPGEGGRRMLVKWTGSPTHDILPRWAAGVFFFVAAAQTALESGGFGPNVSFGGGARHLVLTLRLRDFGTPRPTLLPAFLF